MASLPPNRNKYNVSTFLVMENPLWSEGLEQVVLKGMGESTSSCLVSDGAECIMISKLFFRKHLTQDLAKQIRKKIQPFPSEDILQQKLQTQIEWEVFKHLTLLDHLDFNKHVQTVSWKH